MSEDQSYQHIRMLEAILFASSEPISLDELSRRMPPSADVAARLSDLVAQYERRGVHLVRSGGRYGFRTAPDLAEFLVHERETRKKLSRAAMEVMAIVAYHQPVTRTEIENILGVATGRGTLDQLIEAGWIKPGRRRQTPGRPATWVTTPEFLDHFGLETLSDLPNRQELSATGMLDARPAIDALPPDDPGLFDRLAETDEEAEENHDNDGSVNKA